MAKSKTLPQLKKELWKWFSIFIRTRNVDDNGYDNCVTCGSWKHWREVDAGHYITRGDLATCFDERNVHFQCKRCNLRGGEQYLMAKYLDKVYGEGTADELQSIRKNKTKFDRHWYIDKIQYYKEIVKNHENYSR